MKPISADSHVVDAEAVFTGLVDRFGDDAPRVMYAGTEKDAIVIPAKGRRGVRPRMGWAGMRLRAGVPIERRPGHKPEVDDLTDPEAPPLIRVVCFSSNTARRSEGCPLTFGTWSSFSTKPTD